LHGGHDPRASGPGERWWFAVVYALARPLAGAGVRPGGVTLASVVLAAGAVGGAAAGRGWALAAAALVVGSALLDGVDGAVAVLGGRASRWGYVVDSLADRLAEALFGVAVWLVGVPGWLCLLAVGLGWLHEYVRARAVGAGLRDIGAVTVGERPTRVIFAAAALLAGGALPGSHAATVSVAGWAVVAAAGLVQLLVVVRRSLSS
jgi:phosphatidylglycerophosphate synthase